MAEIINIYCDESGHLENDKEPAMLLGAVSCTLRCAHEVMNDIRDIKEAHGLKRFFEIKWSKVSPAKLPFYESLIDYFFEQKSLKFRAVVAGKGNLQHEAFGQTHNEWYYKMYYLLLYHTILDPSKEYHIYLDVKDTRGRKHVNRLKKILCTVAGGESITKMQLQNSDNVELMQLCDLLIGAIAYKNSGRTESTAKLALDRKSVV